MTVGVSVECPVCGGGMDVALNVLVGELLDCGECGSELEVRGLSPLQIEEAPMSAEDWGE